MIFVKAGIPPHCHDGALGKEWILKNCAGTTRYPQANKMGLDPSFQSIISIYSRWSIVLFAKGKTKAPRISYRRVPSWLWRESCPKQNTEGLTTKEKTNIFTALQLRISICKTHLNRVKRQVRETDKGFTTHATDRQLVFRKNSCKSLRSNPTQIQGKTWTGTDVTKKRGTFSWSFCM